MAKNHLYFHRIIHSEWFWVFNILNILYCISNREYKEIVWKYGINFQGLESNFKTHKILPSQ